MRCKSCSSEDLGKFNGEMAIHLPGLKNIAEPAFWVFPEVVVCLGCGAAQFVIPECTLRMLGQRRLRCSENPSQWAAVTR